MSENGELLKLKKLLENQQWPLKYTFKFIVPSGKEKDVMSLVVGGEGSVRSSSKGKYASVTIEKFFACSDDVIEIYRQAAKIPGLMAL